MTGTIAEINEAVAFINNKIDFDPKIGIILGTGLSSIMNEVDVKYVIDYAEIPHFPVATVETHAGKLVFGILNGKQVVIMQGRFHYYEGYSMKQVTFPVRVMKVLGIENLIVTNVSGGLDPDYEVGDVMIIKDHINLQPENPLVGKNIDELGGRWPDMSEPYDKALIKKAKHIAHEQQIEVREGVYVSVSGPNLETPAEYKFLRIIGADTVGMSTVPEIIVARHMDLPCFAMSIITDLGVLGKIKPVSVEEILKAAAEGEPKLVKIVSEMVAAI